MPRLESTFSCHDPVQFRSNLNWSPPLISLILQLFDLSKVFDKENSQDGRNTLYNFGITGKLCRLLFEINKKTVLRVKTGAGLLRAVKLRENIIQCSIEVQLILILLWSLQCNMLSWVIPCHYMGLQSQMSFSLYFCIFTKSYIKVLFHFC